MKLEEGLKDVWFLSHLNSHCFSKASGRLLYFAVSHAVCSVIKSTRNVSLLQVEIISIQMSVIYRDIYEIYHISFYFPSWA